MGCETQQEIDELWSKLTAGGGASSRCGWLKDKFGLSWQIVPNALGRLMGGGTPEQSKARDGRLFKMDKLELNELQRAFDAA